MRGGIGGRYEGGLGREGAVFVLFFYQKRGGGGAVGGRWGGVGGGAWGEGRG